MCPIMCLYINNQIPNVFPNNVLFIKVTPVIQINAYNAHFLNNTNKMHFPSTVIQAHQVVIKTQPINRRLEKLKTTAINLDQCQCRFVADIKAGLLKLSDKLQNILCKVYTSAHLKKTLKAHD